MGRQSRLRATRKALRGLIAKECITAEQATAQYREEKGRTGKHEPQRQSNAGTPSEDGGW